MTIQVQTRDHQVDTYFHVISATVDGESNYLTVAYTDEGNGGRKDKVYHTGTWSSFYTLNETVGGF